MTNLTNLNLSKAHFSTRARAYNNVKRFLIALIDWNQIWDQFFKALQEIKNLLISRLIVDIF